MTKLRVTFFVSKEDSPSQQPIHEALNLFCANDERVEYSRWSIADLRTQHADSINRLRYANVLVVEPALLQADSWHQTVYYLNLRSSAQTQDENQNTTYTVLLVDGQTAMQAVQQCDGNRVLFRADTSQPTDKITVVDVEAEDSEPELLKDVMASYIQDIQQAVGNLNTNEKKWRENFEIITNLKGDRISQEDQKRKEAAMKSLRKLFFDESGDIATGEKAYDLMTAYREVAQWNKMINFYEELGKKRSTSLIEGKEHQVRYLAAFAYMKNKQPDKADELVECIINDLQDIQDDDALQVLKREALGLKGSINKTKFLDALDSGDPRRMKENMGARAKAIEAYNTAFELDEALAKKAKKVPDLYGLVNALTLIFLGSDLIQHEAQVQDLLNKANTVSGRMAPANDSDLLSAVTDYWAAASVFEVNLVDFCFPWGEMRSEKIIHPSGLLVRACRRMLALYKATWMIESTMKNATRIFQMGSNLIFKDEQKQPEYKQVEWWMDFLSSINESTDSIQSKSHWKALIKADETTDRPMSIFYESDEGDVSVHPGTDGEASGFIRIQLMKAENPIRIPLEQVYLQRISKHHPYDTSIANNRCLGFDRYKVLFPTQACREAFVDMCINNGYKEQERMVLFKCPEFSFDMKAGERVCLGKGASGEVFLATRDDEDPKLKSKKLAVKKFKDVGSLFARSEARSEAEQLQKLEHDNVVRFFGVKEDMNEAYLVLEYVPGGNFKDMLHFLGPLHPFPSSMRSYMRQLLSALEYVHGQNVIHGDIKPDNVLINQRNGQVKLTDFSVSSAENRFGTRSMHHQGALLYAPPEAQSQGGRPGWSDDIWAFGCTMLEMLTDNLFELFGASPDKLNFRVDGPPTIPDLVPEEAREVLQKCFQRSPASRARASTLLSMAYFAPTAQSPSHDTQPRQDFSRTSSVASMELDVLDTPLKLEKIRSGLKACQPGSIDNWFRVCCSNNERAGSSQSRHESAKPKISRAVLDDLMHLFLLGLEKVPSKQVSAVKWKDEIRKSPQLLQFLREYKGKAISILNDVGECFVKAVYHEQTREPRVLAGDFCPHWIFLVHNSVRDIMKEIKSKASQMIEKNFVEGASELSAGAAASPKMRRKTPLQASSSIDKSMSDPPVLRSYESSALTKKIDDLVQSLSLLTKSMMSSNGASARGNGRLTKAWVRLDVGDDSFACWTKVPYTRAEDDVDDFKKQAVAEFARLGITVRGPLVLTTAEGETLDDEGSLRSLEVVDRAQVKADALILRGKTA